MQGARGGIDLPCADADRVKSYLAKYYAKMDDPPPGRMTVGSGRRPLGAPREQGLPEGPAESRRADPGQE
jgi:hypothetical protein